MTATQPDADDKSEPANAQMQKTYFAAGLSALSEAGEVL